MYSPKSITCTVAAMQNMSVWYDHGRPSSISGQVKPSVWIICGEIDCYCHRQSPQVTLTYLLELSIRLEEIHVDGASEVDQPQRRYMWARIWPENLFEAYRQLIERSNALNQLTLASTRNCRALCRHGLSCRNVVGELCSVFGWWSAWPDSHAWPEGRRRKQLSKDRREEWGGCVTFVVDCRTRLLMSNSEPYWENSVTNMLAFRAIMAEDMSMNPSICKVGKLALICGAVVMFKPTISGLVILQDTSWQIYSSHVFGGFWNFSATVSPVLTFTPLKMDTHQNRLWINFKIKATYRYTLP